MTTTITKHDSSTTDSTQATTVGSTPESSTQGPTFGHVDPTTVIVGANVRLDPKLDRAFLASIRERGVLQPVQLYRDGDGTLTVQAGQRRTLAAQQAHLATIPAMISAAAPAEADRLVDQYVENEHRADLTNSERVTAIEQMALSGLSDHQIAKRTAIPKADVAAARTIAQAPAILEFADQLTLEEAATLAEFDDDPEAVETLLEAARRHQFAHAAQRLRNDRAEATRLASYAEQLTAQGITVIPTPRHGDTPTPLRSLTDTDGADLTPENHAGCPGHAAYVDYDWHRTPLTDHDADHDETTQDEDDTDDEDQTDNEDQDDEDQDDEDQDDELDGIDNGWEYAPTARYVCSDPTAHGHVHRCSHGPATKKRADQMSEQERKTARAQRRDVIESNKAWKAATQVRRDWLAAFAHRKTAPAGAESYLATAITRGWLRDRADHDTLTLAGFPTTDTTPSWTSAGAQRDAADTAIAAATPKRALHIGLALAVAAWEHHTTPDTWRAADDHDRTTLTALQTWGYPLSPIEERIIS